MGVDRGSWPGWAWVGICGLSTRGSAWAFVWISLALGAGSVAYGFIDPRFFLGGALVLVALWYYLAIHWVDQHGQWA